LPSLCAVPHDLADRIVAALRTSLAEHTSHRGRTFSVPIFALPCEVVL
jgi:hypothetical protein